MNEALADVLKDRLAVLPLMDRLVGLVRPWQHENGPDGRQVLPQPVRLSAQECENNPRYLVPDENTAAIFFFEDGGTTKPGIQGIADSYRSTVRLLGWLNPKFYPEPITDAYLVRELETALFIGRRMGAGPFVDLLVSYSTLVADTSLFSRYTDMPLLEPPYRVVGLELSCTYRLARCLPSPMVRTGGSTPPVVVLPETVTIVDVVALNESTTITAVAAL